MTPATNRLDALRSRLAATYAARYGTPPPGENWFEGGGRWPWSRAEYGTEPPWSEQIGHVPQPYSEEGDLASWDREYGSGAQRKKMKRKKAEYAAPQPTEYWPAQDPHALDPITSQIATLVAGGYPSPQALRIALGLARPGTFGSPYTPPELDPPGMPPYQYRHYAADARGVEHAPAGSPSGGQFTHSAGHGQASALLDSHKATRDVTPLNALADYLHDTDHPSGPAMADLLTRGYHGEAATLAGKVVAHLSGPPDPTGPSNVGPDGVARHPRFGLGESAVASSLTGPDPLSQAAQGAAFTGDHGRAASLHAQLAERHGASGKKGRGPAKARHARAADLHSRAAALHGALTTVPPPEAAPPPPLNPAHAPAQPAGTAVPRTSLADLTRAQEERDRGHSYSRYGAADRLRSLLQYARHAHRNRLGRYAVAPYSPPISTQPPIPPLPTPAVTAPSPVYTTPETGTPVPLTPEQLLQLLRRAAPDVADAAITTPVPLPLAPGLPSPSPVAQGPGYDYAAGARSLLTTLYGAAPAPKHSPKDGKFVSPKSGRHGPSVVRVTAGLPGRTRKKLLPRNEWQWWRTAQARAAGGR